MEIKLGNLYLSSKHGVGQVVDCRHGRNYEDLWVIMYRDGSFGSYYSARINQEFRFVRTAPLPAGFPKIARARQSAEIHERAATRESRGFQRSKNRLGRIPTPYRFRICYFLL